MAVPDVAPGTLIRVDPSPWRNPAVQTPDIVKSETILRLVSIKIPLENVTDELFSSVTLFTLNTDMVF